MEDDSTKRSLLESILETTFSKIVNDYKTQLNNEYKCFNL